jgi:hypothetical protein
MHSPTRPLILRVEQPPDELNIVVRAGVMSRASIQQAANRTLGVYGLYGISVEGIFVDSLPDACRLSERLVGYRQIRLSTFGRLRRAGFALLATFDHPHFTLVLPDLSENTVDRLNDNFDSAIPNPGRFTGE